MTFFRIDLKSVAIIAVFETLRQEDADIVFWTYNWGYAPEKARLKLIKNLPQNITLLVTFEMFEAVRRKNAVNTCTDYIISFTGPGEYFRSEAELAA